MIDYIRTKTTLVNAFTSVPQARLHEDQGGLVITADFLPWEVECTFDLDATFRLVFCRAADVEAPLDEYHRELAPILAGTCFSIDYSDWERDELLLVFLETSEDTSASRIFRDLGTIYGRLAARNKGAQT